MAKLIPLTKGQFAIVDDEDHDELMKYRWTAWKGGNTWYARRSKYKIGGGYYTITMHRVIIGAKDNQIVDHKDRNGLNNQKNNLRLCTRSENSKNKKAVGISGFLGVSIRPRKILLKNGEYHIYDSWVARIKVKNKTITLGCFRNKIDAAKAYNKAAKKYHGEFVNLNIIN